MGVHSIRTMTRTLTKKITLKGLITVYNFESEEME